MKTTISTPDRIDEAAEHLAERVGMSRSKLGAQAVEQLVRAHEAENS